MVIKNVVYLILIKMQSRVNNHFDIGKCPRTEPIQVHVTSIQRVHNDAQFKYRVVNLAQTPPIFL